MDKIDQFNAMGTQNVLNTFPSNAFPEALSETTPKDIQPYTSTETESNDNQYSLKVIPILDGDKVKIQVFVVTQNSSTAEQTSLSFNEFKLPLGEWYKLTSYSKSKALNADSTPKTNENLPPLPPTQKQSVSKITKIKEKTSNETENSEPKKVESVDKEEIWIRFNLDMPGKN